MIFEETYSTPFGDLHKGDNVTVYITNPITKRQRKVSGRVAGLNVRMGVKYLLLAKKNCDDIKEISLKPGDYDRISLDDEIFIMEEELQPVEKTVDKPVQKTNTAYSRVIR